MYSEEGNFNCATYDSSLPDDSANFISVNYMY